MCLWSEHLNGKSTHFDKSNPEIPQETSSLQNHANSITHEL